MNKIIVEISIGELLDKISILEIKKDKIKDPEKLRFISNEHSILKNQLENNIKTDNKLDELFQSLKEINDKLMPLHKSLFIESSPSPVKYAASLLNLSSDEVRLPLVKITEETKKSVKSAMTHAQLI